MKAFEYIAGQPWLITNEYLQLIAEITSQERSVEEIAKGVELAREKREEREGSPAAVAARLGSRVNGARRATLREGGIGVLPVTGPIFRYANLFTAYSGATSTQMLATDFQALIDSSDVRAILLSIDSPGGEAFGINELAGMIRLAAKQKPVVAYVSGMATSAAYWLASAADEIVADSNAILGSIGVVLTVRETKRMEKSRGIDHHEIVSSQSPRKRLEPSSEEGRAALQETADAMAEVFIESVARNRDRSVEFVMANFGQGGVMVGKRAVDAGLADRIGSFESMLAEMAKGDMPKKRRMPMAATSKPATGANSGGKKMSLRQRLIAMLEKEPDEPEAGATQTLVIKTEPPTAAQPPAQPAATQDSDEVTRLKAENAELKKTQAEQRKAALKAEAENFINVKIQACEVLPAVKVGFVKAYIQAGLDDDQNPVAKDEQTRVEMLKAQYEGRPPHKLTEEMGKGKPAETGTRLAGDDDGEKVTPERRAELLSHTDTGRAALKAEKK